MKKVLSLVLILLVLKAAQAQTISSDYADGQVYLRLTGTALKNTLQENPTNIPLSKLKEFNTFLSNYQVTKISRPFYQAEDDAVLPGILKIQFAKKNLIDNLISDLMKTGVVAYAEKVPLLRTDAVPNDPDFPAHLTQINATAAWNIFNGNSNISVAIVDDAVMWSHADLSANIYINPGEIAGNNIDDDNNGYIDDVNGWDASDIDNDPTPTNLQMLHGTHCAGIAGARTDNATGVASIGWNIKIIPVKCQPDNGSTSGITNGYEGIIYATRAGARVISCSWGGSYSSTGQAVVDYSWDRGCLVVASAGNSGSSTPAYPAAYNNVYAVASVDNSDVKSGFSNYGNWVDISAPGENVNSTVPYIGTPAYQQLSGTSMAGPMVAGLAGLMLSKCSFMTPADLIHCISSTAFDVYTLNGNSAYASGYQLGAGRIDAFQAMTCAAGYLTYPPVANFFAFPASSCTSTPVHFSDSSLYLPTSWQWAFESGSPATSTSSNPIVQWSTPGTYSVMLTVSNANGSNSKTRLSYITIANPGALPFSEGFQGTAFLPAGWIAKNIGNDDIYWQHKMNLGGYGTSNACAMFDNFNFNTAGDRDEMWTPKFSFSNVVQSTLKFDVAYARYDAVNSDSMEVRLSTDCGTSWSTIYLKGGTSLATAPDAGGYFVPQSSQWRTDSIDISAFTAGQGSVMFSFVNHGQYGQPIYLDNINLFFPTPTVTIDAPLTSCVGAPVTFTNSSEGVGGYAWDLTGATPAASSLSNPTVTYNSPGIYTITVIGTNGSEAINYVMTLQVQADPTIALTATNLSCGTCTDGSIHAQITGGSGNYTYSWMPSGGNAASATGLSAGCYTLNASSSGCTSTASACVDFATGLTTLSITQNDLTIYPNPTNQGVTVSLSVPFSYHLYTINGELLVNDKTNSLAFINLDKFSQGVYVLQIETGSSVLWKKIIKN